jgi:hypothetical protein
MVTEEGDFKFNPTDEVASSFKEQYRKPPRKLLRALKKGQIKEIPMGREFQYRSWQSWHSDPTREGFVTIQPFTRHCFLLPYPLLADQSGTPSALVLTIEYEAWPERRKIIQIETNRSVDQMIKTVKDARNQLFSGSINVERQKLGKSLIKIRHENEAEGVSL